jgi:adenylate cyclase
MALSYRDRKNWKQVGMIVALGVAIGLAYSTLRMMVGVLPFSWAELENSARTGGFIALCLGWFMTFIVYDTPGEVFRRMGFVKGWLLLELISVLIIVVSMTVQRVITSLIWSDLSSLKYYFQVDILFDVLVAVLIFLLVTFIMQMRRLVGEGIMWSMITGRYHQPRRERRVYMFLDIRDSTAIAEKLGDEKTHAFISDVFFIADRLVSEHRGEVLSYNGDELVASWHEDVGLEDSRCLSCYQDIIKAMAANSDHYQKTYGTTPEFWVGFHVGDVVVGECGDGKLAIVHIGDTPNTAARLEHHAKDIGRACLASSTLIERLTLPDTISAEPIGSVTLKGHSHDTDIFAIELT